MAEDAGTPMDMADSPNGNDVQQQHADPSRVLEIPLASEELLEINLDELRDDDTIQEVAELFKTERTPVIFWIKILNEYYRRGSIETATRLGELGLEAFRSRGDSASTVPLLCMMASYAILHSRTAPKTVLPQPRQYHVKGQPKAYWHQKATALLNQADAIDNKNGFVLDTKASLYLLMGKYDEAYRTYEFILSQSPNHLFALMGKARILYMKRQLRQALKIYQSVLSASPSFLPDPRIGIGLCMHNLGEHAMARKAWERSRTVHPGKESSAASLLLGLSYMHESRDIRRSEEDRVDAYSTAIRYIQQAWAADKTCAATAAALAGYFLTSISTENPAKWDTIVKLAELAIQHGEPRPIISEGHLAIARTLHFQDKVDESIRHYALAVEANPDQIEASLALGQIHIRKQDYLRAIDTFEKILRRYPRSIEAMVSLASLHSRSALLQSSSPYASTTNGNDPKGEGNTAKKAATELFEQVVRLFQGTKDLKDGLGERDALDPLGPRVQQIATDPDLYVEIARLSIGDDIGKSLSAYRQSLSVRRDREAKRVTENGEDSQEGGEQSGAASTPSSIPPELLCNIGSLEFARGELESAQERFEEAVTIDLEKQQSLQSHKSYGANGSSAMNHEAEDAVMMTVMYNLGIVMEARGQKEEAVQLYENRLLARHPEFLEAKARLAAIALADKQHERCNDFLKAALTAQPGHLDIRALFTHFQIEVGNFSAAKDFAVMTLKDFSKTDIYALSAMATLLYSQARESRDTRPEGVKDRVSRFYRAVEAFDRVLQLDPHNYYAAQGIAIALAENHLGSSKMIAASGATASLASTEAAHRQKNLKDALRIFARVRETANDGNVYVNIGLCYYLDDQYEKAIESFNAANNRFYHNKHLPTLLYLARAQFHKAQKDQSFEMLQKALQSARTALELAPKDDSIRFNIALIQQRGLETLQSLPPSARRVAEIQTALADAEAAQETFAQLASNRSPNLPYSVDLADQRRRYGESLIKRAPITIKEQEEYEQSAQAKIEMAKRDREAERARQAEIERQKAEEARQRAEELAAVRRQLMEDSRTWYQKPVEESEDESEKKAKRGKKKKQEDDGIVPDGEGEEQVKPKKRKKAAAAVGEDGQPRRRKKSAKAEAGTEEKATAAGSDEDEDDGPVRPSKRSKKQFRTKEVISDSDVSD